jgi:hypothetical protein
MFVGSMFDSVNHFPSNIIRSSLMCPPSIEVSFEELHLSCGKRTWLLHGTTACQLKNDYGVVPGELSCKLYFSLFRQGGSTLPGRLQT